MKLKQILGIIVFGIALIFGLSSHSQQISPNHQIEGIWKVVATKCVCIETGETIAFSNNCAYGNGDCKDRSCPTQCP